MPAFSTVLVANRGEIAVRVLRTAKALGYRTVAVYSEADAAAPHVRLADAAYALGAPEAAESYLNAARLIEAARATGADAVHPGYGFLSENAEFAAACAAAGLVFIGPPPEAIRLMGNKRQAKLRMEAAGVPCVPGYHGAEQTDEALLAAARSVGWPVMVKAAAGGGGRGMRLAASEADLRQALPLARAEAQAAFGSAELIVERALSAARHVEIQVFADRQGAAIHLGERDCSTQRRHQKVIEEAPSPAVTPELRARMGAAACAAARAVGYVGAGTVEFMLDAGGAFYFLEMNTRLQVEHPVTEAVTGLDLVEWQLRVAAGEPLPLRQEDVRWQGHAIEARLYAEEPAAGYQPRTGRVAWWRPAQGPQTRVDHGLDTGLAITPYYDPLLAKIIAHGATREEARQRLRLALEETVLLGVATNKSFLLRVLEHPEFVAGRVTTEFLGGASAAALLAAPPPPLMWALAAVLRCGEVPPHLARWQTQPVSAQFVLEWAHRREAVTATRRPGGEWTVRVAGQEIHLPGWRGETLSPGVLRAEWRQGGVLHSAHAALAGREVTVDTGARCEVFAEADPAPVRATQAAAGRVLAPMSGKVVAVRAKVGDAVHKGQCLLILEAMKIQHEITVQGAGRLVALPVVEGQQVAPRQLLAEVELAP
jgi:geranyl-CoA carboxylase alpha subunit